MFNSNITHKLGSYPLSTDKHSVNNAASWSLTSSNHQNFRFFQQGAHKSVQNKNTKLFFKNALERMCAPLFSVSLICSNIFSKWCIL